MAAHDPVRRQEVAKIAAGRRWKTSSPETDEAHRNIKVESLADHIRRSVDAAPPLTAEQRDKLAVLLRGPDAA